MSSKLRRVLLILAFCIAIVTTCSESRSFAADDKKTEIDTKIKCNIAAKGVYVNWDGVSNVAQFVDSKGNFCLAYDDGDYVVVVRTNNDGSIKAKKIKLKKTHSIFGNVICDEKGNYYVVTGENNTGDDTNTETIFISKYNSKGKLLGTVGNNGSSSLAYYYGTSFYTKNPFEAGNCDIAVNGDLLSVNYARKMYSGHQSNSVFTINTKKLEKVDTGVMYESHSFAQRVIAYKDGFAYASEGDCYERAFTINTDSLMNSGIEKQVFHFWVSEGAFDRYDMYEVNDNFAHMGGLANINDNTIALVGTSVKSLNSNAKSENEQLFIQIFDPESSTTGKAAYVTKGTRTGMAGRNGNESVTDYGVKWLTNFGDQYTVKNPQVVAVDGDSKGKLVVMYEKYDNYKFLGTYYIVINGNGKVLKKSSLYSKDAHLNPCTMPVYSNGKISWAGNKESEQYGSRKMYIFSLEIN